MASKYWNGEGAYSPEAGALEVCVPTRGDAPTVATELTRCMSRLVYERFNNGNGNRSDYFRKMGQFIGKFREELTEFVGKHGVLFKFGPKRLRTAMTPVLGIRGGSGVYEAETDIVCDAVYKYASTLAGFPVFAFGEEKGFVDAVLTNPNDVAARLAWADWLDERDKERSLPVRLHAMLLLLNLGKSPSEALPK